MSYKVFAPDVPAVAWMAKENSWALEELSSEKPNAIFLGDGKVLAAFGQKDKAITLWSVPEGKQLATLDTGVKGVQAVWASPDRKRLAARDMLGNVKIWDLNAKK